jgi:hypothetical protein
MEGLLALAFVDHGQNAGVPVSRQVVGKSKEKAWEIRVDLLLSESGRQEPVEGSPASFHVYHMPPSVVKVQ